MLALQAMVFVAAACLVQVHGYGSGAPTDACDDMVPQHHTPPQNSPVPYKIRSARGREAGTAIISIKGPGPFKGFLAQCRVGDQPVGKFINLPSTAKAVDCGSGKASAATHSSSADKESVTLQWQAPPGLKEQVTCYATVAKNGKEFWVKVPTNTLTF